MIYFHPFTEQAGVAELADARDSKSRTFGYVGSIPTFGMNGSGAQKCAPRFVFRA